MTTALERVDPTWAWSPYTPDPGRPWDRARAAHLYRRAGFGATSEQLDAAVARAPGKIIDDLLAAGASSAAGAFNEEVAELASSITASGKPENLSAWWLFKMVGTPDPLREKMTLFWHGHFATSAAKVTEPRLVLGQHRMLHRGAFGPFADLLKGISRDPAMLVYLDSTSNRKLRPNENFAREIMELFSLGEGNYSERDIKEVARCFTGWEVRQGQVRFNRFQHDRGEKTIFGQRGAFNGDDAVRIILQQPAAARFIVGKAARFFVAEEPALPAALLEPLVDDFRRGGYDAGALVRRILGSQIFFSSHALGRKVRSPVELAVGLLRSLGGRTNVYRLAENLLQLGQGPFFPPSVKGWDGGRTWINSSTLLGRANLVRRLVNTDDARFGGGKLDDLARRHAGDDPDALVGWLLGLLLAIEPPPEARGALLELARKRPLEGRAAAVIQAASTLPEFQLG